MSEEKINSTFQESPVEVSPADDGEILEVRHYTPQEIAASGKWYDQRYFGLPSYSNSLVQVVMLSFVLFLCPGCFNAITGLGGSGISDAVVADHQNIALYCTFSVGIYSGIVVNKLGPKICLMIGGSGYLIYVASLLNYQRNQNVGFCIFAGAYLGVCASLTWAVQGSMIMSYSSEDRKGLFFAVNWIIFNVGTVIGSCIPLAQAIQTGTSSASTGTFAAFMALVGCGIVVASLLLPMDKVYKLDGSKVVASKYPSIKSELKGMYHVLVREPKIYLLIPMFATSNWYYTYQFNDFNGGGKFDLKARSLNSLLYWFSQMVGALLLGVILDWGRFRRSVRAKIGWVVVFVLGMAIWGGGLKFQLGYDRDSKLTAMSFNDRGYIGPMFLYMFYGMFDAMYQSFIIWILGSMSNNPRKTAIYASLYKSFQSAFAAIVWALDSRKVSFMALFGSSWGMCGGSLLIAVPLVFFMITDHTDMEKDGMKEILEDDVVVVKTIEEREIKAEDA